MEQQKDSGIVCKKTPDGTVAMSNALVCSGHGLTLAEKRLIALASLEVDSRRSEHVLPKSIKITASIFSQTFSIDPNTAYEQLKEAGKHLFERKITYNESDRLGKVIKKQMRWVGSVHYHEGEGWIQLSFWHEVIPHITSLHKRFTKYKLQQASALRSIHSWRLMEILVQFKSTGWREMGIEEFSDAMEATEKQRKDFAAVRRKIIEPAVKELQEKSNWMIQWKPIKTGRRVSSIRFDFRMPGSQ